MTAEAKRADDERRERDDPPEERPEQLDASLVVLEANKALRYGAALLLLVGPLVFAAAGFLPHGLFGAYVAVFGLIAARAFRRNARPTRRQARVRATREGVFVDGALRVPRANIADGFFQPRAGGSYGSSVRLVGKGHRVVFEAEADEEQSQEILRVLGLDAQRKRAEFRGAPPLYATRGRAVVWSIGIVGVFLALGVLGGTLGLGMLASLPAVPLFFAGMAPSTITVGADGILVRWLWQSRFIPMSEIETVTSADDAAIRIHLTSGREEILYAGGRRSRRRTEALENRNAVLARITEALEMFRARGSAVDVSALVGRGTRTHGAWVEALWRLGRAEAGYRDAALRKEDLFRLVEDPGAAEDARAGAAMVLRGSLDEEGKSRVRVAAEASASPKLRVALDAAASDGSDLAAHEALAALAGDVVVDRVIDATVDMPPPTDSEKKARLG